MFVFEKRLSLIKCLSFYVLCKFYKIFIVKFSIKVMWSKTHYCVLSDVTFIENLTIVILLIVKIRNDSVVV